MQKVVLTLTTLLLLVGLSSSVSAETINLGVKKGEFIAQLPSRGMTKESVVSQFGKPIKKTEAVGNPPISKWLYPRFSVYFETNHVIHAVIE